MATPLYPTAKDVFTEKVDLVTEIIADHVNTLQSVVRRIEDVLGLEPAGSLLTVVDRLDVSQNSDGTPKTNTIPATALQVGLVGSYSQGSDLSLKAMSDEIVNAHASPIAGYGTFSTLALRLNNYENEGKKNVNDAISAADTATDLNNRLNMVVTRIKEIIGATGTGATGWRTAIAAATAYPSLYDIMAKFHASTGHNHDGTTAWAGPKVTVVGTIGSGTWNGSTIGVGYGGTGITNLTAGYIPYGAASSPLASTSNLIWSVANTRLETTAIKLTAATPLVLSDTSKTLITNLNAELVNGKTTDQNLRSTDVVGFGGIDIGSSGINMHGYNMSNLGSVGAHSVSGTLAMGGNNITGIGTAYIGTLYLGDLKLKNKWSLDDSTKELIWISPRGKKYRMKLESVE